MLGCLVPKTPFVSDKTTQLGSKPLRVENYIRPGHTPKRRRGSTTGRVLAYITRRAPDTPIQSFG